MADFPTLTVTGRPQSHRRRIGDDPTLSVQFAGGYEETRQVFTRSRYEWDLEYGPMPEADKQTLVDFVQDQGVGANAFNWTDPATGDVHSVRFLGLPEWRPVEFMIVDKTLWWVRFSIKEV